MAHIKYEAWKGSLIDHYFGHLDKGVWVSINYLRYFILNARGYTVRKIIVERSNN